MEKDFFKLGIIGYPLSHSISPTIQSAALKSINAEGSYEKFQVEAKDLAEQVKFFIENGFRGFNVTIPHKVEILKYLDEIDPAAANIGAVNTVKINEKGKLSGYNTDIYGFIEAIPAEFKKPKNVVLLGCGGAALAVVFGLNELGVENLKICARNLEKAQNFAKKIENKVNMNISIENLAEINSLNSYEILINSTPLGTKGENQSFMPISKEVLKTAEDKLFIYDLIYNPAKTLFLEEAEKLGLNYINGLDMLILQGAKAFEIWTGETPSIEEMKKSALGVL